MDRKSTSNSEDMALISQILGIVAWVFIWEAVDIGAFQNRTLRVNRMRYQKLAEMDVRFICEEGMIG